MMDELSLLGSDWRTRSPDADQEYFIDKMRMLKARLRKYEEENRVLFRCLAEQKTDVREARKDKSFAINHVQYELSELRKHILVLYSALAEDQDASTISQLQQQIPPALPSTSSSSSSSLAVVATGAIPRSSEYDKCIWMSRNKSLEENFKKELRKVKELERQLVELDENFQLADKEREDLQEKNAFIEEENNIQREQIALLEDTVRDLEEVALRTGAEVEEMATQTEVRGEELMAIMNENVEEIVCLVSKLAELQQRNVELESQCEESRNALASLHHDFHERGKLMSALENELNALKLRDRSGDRLERRRRHRSCSLWEDEQTVLNLSASVFLSPNSSRSCSTSNSSVDYEEEESGISLEEEEATETKKTELRKFIRNLKCRRRTLHDTNRYSDT